MASGPLTGRLRNPVEYMTIDESFNPVIPRIKHAVKDRAIYPDMPVPEIPAILTKFSTPPANLVEQAQAHIDTLIEVAEVKKGKYCHPLHLSHQSGLLTRGS